MFVDLYTISENWLREKYIEEKLTIQQIATLINCSKSCIQSRLLRYKISIRTNSESHKGKPLNHKSDCQCSFCKAKRGELKGKKLYENVIDHPSYIDGRSLKTYYCINCGKKIKWTTWVYGEKRCRNCSKKGDNNPSFKFRGTGHWNYVNGKSLELYPLGWNNTFKEQIRFRDKYKCRLCGKPEIENNRKLDVHHKDYNKNNLNPNNLISLCKSCHMKTNWNRGYWEEYFNG